MRLYTLERGERPIIIAAPHAGVLQPGHDIIPLDRIMRAAEPDITPATRRLARLCDATLLTCHATRLWVDLDRRPDDRDPHGAAAIMPDMPDWGERGERLGALYLPWHRTIGLLARLDADRCGHATLLTVHTHADTHRIRVSHAPDTDAMHARTLVDALDAHGLASEATVADDAHLDGDDPRTIRLRLDLPADADPTRLARAVTDTLA